MPSQDTIVNGLTTIANDWRGLAIGWHIWLFALAGLLVSGWRPSVRVVARLLVAPVISAGVVAWLAGNPFNGIVFVALAAVLARESFRLPDDPVRLASAAWVARGAAIVAAGAVYPHFLRTDSPAEYVVASPFGLLPCPTLLVVLGATLTFSNLPSRRWSTPLLLAGAGYGAIGVFRLDVALDWALFIATTLLGARLLEQEGLWRRVRAYSFEHARPLRGDDLIPNPLATLTHAVTIHRRPPDVWPWLAQMGAGSRAGWYSYDCLDNGCRPSATRIVPELQTIETGMVLPALPGVDDAFKVLAVEPGRSLVLGWCAAGGEAIVTWTFVLEPMGADATRLITRARGSQAYRFRGLPPAWSRRVIGVVHFFMQRRQLLSIARRAESIVETSPDAAVMSVPAGQQV